MPATLSVCLIVKDEADVLPRCLQSVAGIADEIIAIDTGSTDGSQEILRQAGAKVFDVPWSNDFGAARTEALRRVTCDWALFIDADEAVDPKTAANVKLLLVDLDTPVCFEVPITSYLQDDESGETTLSFMPRLCNKPDEHTWVGRIHEQLIGSRPVRLDPSVVGLLHWGYQPSRVAAKGKDARNQELIKQESAEDGDSIRLALYTAAAAERPEDTIEHAQKALDRIDPTASMPVVVATAAILILKAYNRQEDWQGAIDAAADLLKRFPSLEGEAQYWFLLGEAHRSAKTLIPAEVAYRKAVDLTRENRVLQSYGSEAVPANAAIALSGMLESRKDYQGAYDVLITALEQPRLSVESQAKLFGSLANTLAALGRVDDAWTYAQKAVEALPSLRATVANLFLDRGELVMAIRLMAPMLDPVTLGDRANMLATSRMGNPQAAQVLEWYLREYGENPGVRMHLAQHLVANRDEDAAAEAIAKAIDCEPHDARVELQLAYYQQTLGLLNEAESRLARLVQAAAEADAPDILGEALVQWGNLAGQRGDWDKAADIFGEAINLKPQDPYVHYGLASARYALGDLQAARTGYERALVLDPSFAGAHEGLDVLAETGAP